MESPGPGGRPFAFPLPRRRANVMFRLPGTRTWLAPGGLMKRLAFFVCTFIACAGVERTAAAQQAPTAPPTFTTPAGKGIIGGALLGAEAVMLVEAAAETKPAWA